jgi:Uma2 family endonuclease
MSGPALRPWTVEEFLAWEREQPERWEFDGVQPVPGAMVGGLRPHVRLSARLLIDLAASLPAECKAYGADLKVVAAGHIRYPDAMIECGRQGDSGDVAEPTVGRGSKRAISR